MENEKCFRGPASASRRVGRRTKKHNVASKRDDSASSSVGSSSRACTSDSETQHLTQCTKGQVCLKALNEQHVCLEQSDTFSDTTYGENDSGEDDVEDKEGEEETSQGSSSVHSSIGRPRRKKGSSKLTKRKAKKRRKKSSEGPESVSDSTEAKGTAKSDDKSKYEMQTGETDSNDGKQNEATEQEERDEGLKSKTMAQEEDTVLEDLTPLLDSLKLLLPSNWVADMFAIPGPAIRLMCHTSTLNAAVERCIYWLNGKVGIFVHNIPVPLDCLLLQQVKPPEKANLGSIADYLGRLVDIVSTAKVCSGISEHKELWLNSPDKFVDKQDCFHSKDCYLLLKNERGSEPTCRACVARQKKLVKEAAKIEKGDKPTVSVNDKFLSKDQLVTKKNFYKTKASALERKSKKLQNKVKNLQVKLDEVLHDELLASLKKNQHKMTKLQKWFWQSQFDAVGRPDKRGLRWHPMMVRIALMLESDPSTIREFVQLPSKRRLYDYNHYLDAKEGCQSEILKEFKEKLDKEGTEKHSSFVNLMFDEMHVRSGLVTSRSSGRVIGYTQLTELETELMALQDDLKNQVTKPKLAKKILVYYIHAITNDVEGVVALYSSDELSAAQLFTRTWDVIYNLEDCDIKVLCLTFDGAAVNRKFARMHASSDNSKDFIYCTNNLASGEERPLFFIVDPPHLMKTVRNNLANSFCHKKTRKLWKNGEFISWKVIEIIHDLTKTYKYRLHKLTQAHVKLTSFSCMKVSFAAQVCSNSVAQVIENMSSHEKLKNLDTKELVKLLRLMNRFFDCMNAKEKEGITPKQDQAAFKSSDDERIEFLRGEFLNFFEDWKKDVINRPGYFTGEARSRFIISHQSLEALKITVHAVTGAINYMLGIGAPAINARVFNQDRLEQYFSSVRQSQGDNRNPTLSSSMDTRMKLHVQSQAARSMKGNTEVEKRPIIEVDDSALPCRKRPKK